jgi:GDP-4-dehydro-6-deoxy-D-mannose reductase
MNILVTRAFNMTGPRRAEAFVDSNFAKQIAWTELIANETSIPSKPILHGNLDSIRDFTDARDTVRAYWLLSHRKWHGDAINVCSGVGHSMLEVLDKLSGMSSKPIRRLEDPTRMRPSDVPILIGDNTKLKMYTGWSPSIPWEESLEELLNYWRDEYLRC